MRGDMDVFLKHARGRGVRVIHALSDSKRHYLNEIGRERGGRRDSRRRDLGGIAYGREEGNEAMIGQDSARTRRGLGGIDDGREMFEDEGKMGDYSQRHYLSRIGRDMPDDGKMEDYSKRHYLGGIGRERAENSKSRALRAIGREGTMREEDSKRRDLKETGKKRTMSGENFKRRDLREIGKEKTIERDSENHDLREIDDVSGEESNDSIRRQHHFREVGNGRDVLQYMVPMMRHRNDLNATLQDMQKSLPPSNAKPRSTLDDSSFATFEATRPPPAWNKQAEDWNAISRLDLIALNPPSSLKLNLVCGNQGKSMFLNRKPKNVHGLNLESCFDPLWDVVSVDASEIYAVLNNPSATRILYTGVHLDLCILYSRWFSLLRVAKFWNLNHVKVFGIVVPLVDTSIQNENADYKNNMVRNHREVLEMALWIRDVAAPQVLGKELAKMVVLYNVPKY